MIDQVVLVFFVRLLLEVVVLYALVAFAVEWLLLGFSRTRLEHLLQTRRPLRGLVLAAGIGAITPFCTYTVVPLAHGMRRGGVGPAPLTAFLLTAPLVNPATLTVLTTLAGPAYGFLYLAACFAVAFSVAGAAHLLPTAWHVPTRAAAPDGACCVEEVSRPGRARVTRAAHQTAASLTRMLPAIVIAAAAGAILHGRVAATWLESTLAGTDWWLVPAAALVGVPIYASTPMLIPFGTVLFEAGVQLGPITALLMGATGFSIPEAVLLHHVLGPRYLLFLAVAFTAAVMLTGYGVQALT